jgi:hypothetical protein
MGMDLSGAGGYFRWTIYGWSNTLELAEQYGWHPMGTGAPRGILKGNQSGSYFSNDGQLFYARDARNLAEALERALEEIPTEKLKKNGSNWLFTKEGKESLKRFIIFCRKGSFRIY